MNPRENSPHYVFARLVAQADEEIDLGRVALLIALPEYPELDIDQYLSRIDRWGAEVRERAGENANPYRLIAATNHVLFNEAGFHGNQQSYYDPKNSFLNEVIERKTGIPISLSVLYLEVARRAGLTVQGVGFPGHFLVRCEADEEVLVDPFHAGMIRSVEDLKTSLDKLYEGEVPFQPQFLDAATKKQIIRRMLNNLKAIYLYRGEPLKALAVVERLVMLDPGTPHEIRDRGLLYLKLECFPQALDNLQSYLRLRPDGDDADDIRKHILALTKLTTQLH